MQDVEDDAPSFSMPSRGGTVITGLTGQFGDADVSAISEVLDHSVDDSLDMESTPVESGDVGRIQAAPARSTSQSRIAQLRQEQQELRVKLVMTEAVDQRRALAERLRRATEEIGQILD